VDEDRGVDKLVEDEDEERVLELELVAEELEGDDEDDGGVDDDADDTLEGGGGSEVEFDDCDPEDGGGESLCPEDCELNPDCGLPPFETDAELLLLPPDG